MLFEGIGTRAVVQVPKLQNSRKIPCDLPFTYLKTWPNLKLCKKVMFGNGCLVMCDEGSAW
jgi:hypothetical protein